MDAMSELGPGGAGRRRAIKILAALGAGGAVFGRALAAAAAREGGRVTAEMVREAEWIAGLELAPDERKLMLSGLDELVESFGRIRAVPLDNAVPPALRFDPLPATAVPDGPATPPVAVAVTARGAARPNSDDDLAYASVAELGELLRTRQVSSLELTRLYLDRLRREDPALSCVVTLTEDLALAQARRADDELAAGRYRGPLHGVPWGAKDILAVPGYPTTWGAAPYRDQRLEATATVVSRLDAAGAVLLAKLSVGALAMGDVWFGGKTKNPWNLDQGSSGSSAGPAAATAAGLVGFAIGTETWGSIVSPCTRCGATGLRPTFGRVSRYGAMALSWSMDKIGPIARTVQDCALALAAVAGPDGLDATVVSRPFRWPPSRAVETIRVGFAEALFERDRGGDAETEAERADLAEWRRFDLRTLDTLRGLGVALRPIALPSDLPVADLSFLLSAEAATAFDDLTRSGRDDLLTRQGPDAWPNIFRQAQLVPAVEYIRANRIRTLVLRETERLFDDVDVYVCPTFGGDNLLLTNLTGHPCVVVPNGFRPSNGTPTSITFIGRLHGESEALAVAHAYQQATAYHLARPPLAREEASA